MIAGYILRRLAFLPLTLLLVAFATFIVLRLTGNPVDIFLDINRTPEQVEALTKRLHLDQPLPVQFLIFLGDLLHGDFGESLQFTRLGRGSGLGKGRRDPAAGRHGARPGGRSRRAGRPYLRGVARPRRRMR